MKMLSNFHQLLSFLVLLNKKKLYQVWIFCHWTSNWTIYSTFNERKPKKKLVFLQFCLKNEGIIRHCVTLILLLVTFSFCFAANVVTPIIKNFFKFSLTNTYASTNTHWHVSRIVYKWWHQADCKLLQFTRYIKVKVEHYLLFMFCPPKIS